jgi:hypothetical protein
MKQRRSYKKTIRKKQRYHKQKGGMCPCVYSSMQQKEQTKQQNAKQQNAKQQNGGVVAALITQFNNAASLLTPIGAAFGIKAYRSWKKTRRNRK